MNEDIIIDKPHSVTLTFHVHVRRLVHEVHEELRGVDEDLVSAVADGAVPPRSLGYREARREKPGRTPVDKSPL